MLKDLVTGTTLILIALKLTGMSTNSWLLIASFPLSWVILATSVSVLLTNAENKALSELPKEDPETKRDNNELH